MPRQMIFGNEKEIVEQLCRNKLIRGCIVTGLVWFFFRLGIAQEKIFADLIALPQIFFLGSNVIS